MDKIHPSLVNTPERSRCESLNISVSAAITLFELSQRAARERSDYFLSASRQEHLLNSWIGKHFRNPREQLARLRTQDAL